MCSVVCGLAVTYHLAKVSKCKVLHLGHFNPNYSYTMADIIIIAIYMDLGVIIDKDLKFHVQIAAVINKASRLLELIKFFVHSKNSVLFRTKMLTKMTTH